jgi:hypothetical protein
MVSWRVGTVFLLLLGSLHADLVNPIGNELQLAVPVAAVVVAIFLALVRMLAETISDPKLDAWVKTEFREWGVALIIICFLSAIVTGAVASGGIGEILTGDVGKDNYIDTSVEILDNWLGNFDDAFEDLITAGGKIRTASTYSPYMSVPIWFVSLSYATNPLAGTMILLTPVTMASQALTNAIFLVEGLRLLIVYCDVIVPSIILPGAFIIRLIPFTRRLGNTLIAVAMAAYMFLPLSVIIVNELNQNINMPDPNLSENDFNELSGASGIMAVSAPFCEAEPIRVLLGLGDYPFGLITCAFLLLIPGGQAAYPGCVVMMQSIVYPIIQIIYQVIFVLATIIWEPVVTSGDNAYWLTAFDVIMPFLEELNNLVFLSYINMILVAIITIVGARSLSSVLGGEVYMFGIQRMI